jgi:hypothetical protein
VGDWPDSPAKSPYASSVPKSAKKAYGKQLSTPEESHPLTEHCAAGRSKDESHTPTSPNVHNGEPPSNASAESTLSQRKSAVHDQRSRATVPAKRTNCALTRKGN